jgi:hypothetical protein
VNARTAQSLLIMHDEARLPRCPEAWSDQEKNPPF